MDRNTSGSINRHQPRNGSDRVLVANGSGVAAEPQLEERSWSYSFFGAKARAAQQRLRNTFRESSKPDNERMLNLPSNVGTHVPIDYLSVTNRLSAHEYANETQTAEITWRES